MGWCRRLRSLWVFKDELSNFGAVADLELEVLILRDLDLRGYALSQLSVSLHNFDALGQAQHEGRSRITHICDVFFYWHIDRILDPIALLNVGSIALPEYFMFLITGVTLEVRHVFNKGHCRNFHAIKHLDTLHNIDVAKFLRGRHNYCAGNVELLA